MKKRLFAIIALVLVVVTFTCSCSTTIAYAFTSYWTKSKAYSQTYHEIAEYDVDRVETFTEKIDNKDTGNVTYEFTSQDNVYYNVNYQKGSYRVEVKAVSASALPSDLGITEGQYYHLTTKLEIPVTFTEKTGENKVYDLTDKITSEVYFSDVQNSLHPLWSKKSYISTSIKSTNEGVGKLVRYAYTTELKWNDGKADYKFTDDSATLTDTFDDNFIKYALTNKEKQISYTKFNALDNESLLFAIRGLTLSATYSSSFKIIDTAYDAVQNVQVSGRKIANLNEISYGLTLNGVSSTKENPSTCLVTVGRSDSTYSGTPTLCYYQLMKYDGDDQTIVTESESRACLMKMVTKLDGFGALVYTIKTLNITD